MKKILSAVLAVLMLLTVCAGALAAPVQLSAADADAQIRFIYSKLSTMKQNEAKKAWSYAITDLDRNGQLELLAASEHDADHTTTLMVWEVNKSIDTMVKCVVKVEDGGSFPDIMSESADTFFDDKLDTWHYLFFDNIVISDQEAYSLKCSVTMKDRSLSYDQYAVMHVVTNGGNQTVTYTDMEGKPITEDQFNAAGVSAFPSQSRSGTNFDWFAYDEISLTRLSDSYAVFIGEKMPVKPAPTPKPAPGPSFLMITKNPTNEVRSVGETAWFVAGANTWDSLTWTFVSPGGAEDSPEDFLAGSGASISGATGTTLAISKLESWMSGWGVYCTFRFQGQSARTSTAWITVNDAPQPTTNCMSGTVTDALMSTVTIALDNGTTVQPLRDICSVSGDLNIGCRCDVYYQGSQPSTDNLTYVYIYGSSPQPAYGSMGGTITDASMNYFTVALDGGGSLYLSQQLANMVYGSMTIGCRCDVLYYGDTPTEDNVYEVDVYGTDPPEPEPPEPPEPVSGSMSGTAYEGGGGYAIDLENGDQVYVDAWKCSVEGQFY
ncbi:MAG: hypothetical protein II460_07950, partial [Oscillospiraceae bacterium]|nr:hypothetical protein [Oscillospiraceae bacterium]